MKTFHLLFFVLCFSFLAAQQSQPATGYLPEGKPTIPTKMLCDFDTTGLTITFADGEDRDEGDGDNNAENGAYMTWTATGSSTGLYFNQIIGPDGSTSSIFTPTFPFSQDFIYDEDGDGNMTINIFFGGGSTNDCIDPGTWTIRVWEVLNNNNPLLPDRDGNNDIIGCYTETTVTFLPSCPTVTNPGITITEAGCTSPASIELDIDVTDFYCDQESDYMWTGPNGFTSNTTDIFNLDAGTYTFTIVDFYGCELDPIVVTVGSIDPVMGSCDNPQSPSVFNASDGSFDVNITQGAGDYTIAWTGPVNGNQNGSDGINTIANVPAGTYDVTVTDNTSGCTFDCTVTIDDPPCAIAFDVSLDNIGNVIIDITGGQFNFFVSFTGTSTASQDDLGPYNSSPISLSANLFDVGDYIFTVYEENRPDCSDFRELTIEGPDCSDFIATVEEANNPTCGQDNGNITILLEGGENPTITWVSGPGVSGSNELVLTDLGPGEYSFQAIDDRGCVQEDIVELTGSAALVFDCTGIDETCTDLDDGRIALSVSGGTAPFTLNYTALDPDGNFLASETGLMVANGDTLNNLAPGDYFLSLSDNAGCSLECSTVIEEYFCPFDTINTGDDQAVSIDSVINATVLGGTGGVILDFLGTPDWTYYIASTTSNFDTTQTTAFTPDTLLGLAIDTYTLVLLPPMIDVDTTGFGGLGACCIAEGPLGGPITFVVEPPACDLEVIAFPEDVICFGESSGAISLQVNNAVGAVTVAWEDNSTGATLPGIPAGVYSATVTDEAMCPVIVTTEVFEPSPLSANIEITQRNLCAGDSAAVIVVIVGGGNSPYDYLWSVPGAPNTGILPGLPAGNYSVVVSDFSGCSTEAFSSIIDPPVLSLNCGAVAETNIGTTDGKVGFSLTGGTPPFQFQLNGSVVSRPAQDTFAMLAPGEYTIVVIDDNGCSTSCVSVVNQGGCGNFDVTMAAQQPDCASATGTALATPVSPNGTVTYSWSHGPLSAAVSDLPAGDYSVTATDAFGCQAVGSVSIVAFTDFPQLSAGDFETVCDNDCAEVDLVLSGPEPLTIYFTVDQAGTQVQGEEQMSSGANTLSLCPTDYGFTNWTSASVTFDSITAANGCTRTSGEIRLLTGFPPAVGNESPTICAADTFLLAGEAFHANRTTGDVILPGAAVNGCDSTVAVSLNFFAPAVGDVSPTICAADTFLLAGEAFHANRTTGDVILPGAAVNGCDSTVAVSLNFFAPAVGDVSPTICAADTFLLAGEAFHANRTTGDVILPGAAVNGCDSTVAVSLNFFAPAVGDVSPTICAADTFLLAGEAFHANRTTGDVILPGAAVNGCDSTVAVSLNFFAPAVGDVSPTICAADTFLLAGEAFHANRTTGDVILPGASVNGCDSTVAVSLNFFAPAVGDVSPTICAADTFLLAGEAFHANRTTGDVILPGASVNGCDSTVAVSLNFFAPAVGDVSPTICATDTFLLAGEAFHANRTTGDVILPGASVNGCDSTVAVSVLFFAPAAAPVFPVICASDTFLLAGEAFHLGRTTGDVVLPGASMNGCDSTVSVTLDFFPQPTGVFDTTICTGTSFTYGGRTFDAAVDDELVTLDVPSVNGCDSLVSVTVRLREVPTVNISGDGVVCDDGMLNITISYDGPAEANVTLSSNPAEVISLVSGSTTIQRPVPVGETVTILTAEDGGPCPLITEGSITVTASNLGVQIDVMSGDGVFAVSCADGSDGSVMAIPTGGEGPFVFDWNTGDEDPMLEGLTAGEYSVILTSGRGCTSAANITLNEPDVMAVQVREVPATCLDANPALVITGLTGGVEPYLVSTDDAENFFPILTLPDTSSARIGTTTLRVQDSNGCLLTQDFDFAAPPAGNIQVSPDQALIVRGDSVEITVLTDLDVAGILLTPGPAALITRPDFFVSPDSTTLYVVTAIDSAGCSATKNVLVIVDNFVPVYSPTAFSPNLDGTNDVFRVYGRQNVTAFSDFNIFDRWGNRVFDFPGPVSPQDENWGWDGRASDGRLRQPGAYVFSITVTFTDGSTKVVKGDLVLVR